MFKLVVVGTIAALTFAKEHPINKDIVNEIRQKATTWEAHDVETNPLANYSIEQLKGLLGTKLPEESFLPFSNDEST